jgi:hypothetical protein
MLRSSSGGINSYFFVALIGSRGGIQKLPRAGREVLLRVRRSPELLLKVPTNADERVNGKKVARIPLPSLTAAL